MSTCGALDFAAPPQSAVTIRQDFSTRVSHAVAAVAAKMATTLLVGVRLLTVEGGFATLSSEGAFPSCNIIL